MSWQRRYRIWYFKGASPSRGLILDISPRVLEKGPVLNTNYIVIDPGDTPLMKKQILTEAGTRHA